MGIDLPLRGSSWRLQDPWTFSASVLRTPLFQDFNLRFLQNLNLWLLSIDPFHLRIAMMAQAVSSCNLLLSCRV